MLTSRWYVQYTHINSQPRRARIHNIRQAGMPIMQVSNLFN